MSKKKKKNKKKKSFVKSLVIILIIALVLAGAGGVGYVMLGGSVSLDDEVVVEIPEASTTTAIGEILAENNIIKSELAFRIKVRFQHAGADLKAGKYHFKGDLSLNQVIKNLKDGPAIIGVRLTIPEGYSQQQIIDLLIENGLVTEAEFLQAAANDDFGYDYLPAPGDSLRLQGYLFPETYYFDESTTAHQIISQMLAEFDAVFTQEWRNHLTERGLSVADWVNMAAIVEKEAVVKSDRPIIAGVFYNRLAQGMNLQSCATVQYAQGVVKENLTYQDVEIDSPYNTYINPGLPPGPIANPGKLSLEAALYPEETSYLFFVAKPNRAHIFSETYEEHLKAQSDIRAGFYDNEATPE